ncbi:DUF4489 domain-containing protein [Clostridium chromiireducens]|uniref:DUF4489 domain-containing protein n=1 Tax=Clostridium chromiireducens TaxID=225345 RepID=A0A399IML0_9CLOT|nr:DUF4489 domain-containing protein [Clostridium chromiireducens]RII34250.1 DUF4489 domain-containing protein [Clostridium chromiireducens]
MNLASKANFKNDYENSNKSSDSCRQILKCGEVGQALLFNGASIETSVPAATITLDTSKFCNSCIMFEFTSNIIGTLFQGTLNFQLYRSCNNQLPIAIGPRFSFTQPIAALFANMFTFLVCDCDPCSNECCTYSIVVSPGGPTTVIGNVGIFAARLATIIADNPDHDDDCYPCNKLCHKENRTILKCGTPGSAISITPDTLAGTTFNVSTLTLNTSCLCDPCVKLEFASNLAYSSLSTIESTVVNFQLFKLCDNQRNPIPVGPQLVFSVPFTTLIDPPISPGFSGNSTFSFFVCDCDTCHHECCTYSLVATTATSDAFVTITNARLSAIAADNNCRCC